MINARAKPHPLIKKEAPAGNMPKRRVNSRRKGGKATKINDKANDIGEITPVQVLKMIIEDFEAQGGTCTHTLVSHFMIVCNHNIVCVFY